MGPIGLLFWFMASPGCSGGYHKSMPQAHMYIGVVGGAVGSHDKAGGCKSKWPNDINRGCFEVCISQNMAKSIPSLPGSLVIIPCWMSAWPSKMEPFKDHPSTCGCQMGLGSSVKKTG